LSSFTVPPPETSTVDLQNFSQEDGERREGVMVEMARSYFVSRRKCWVKFPIDCGCFVLILSLSV